MITLFLVFVNSSEIRHANLALEMGVISGFLINLSLYLYYNPTIVGLYVIVGLPNLLNLE